MSEQKHQCSRNDIDWDQVFVETDGLWDPEAEEYVYI